MTLRVLIVEDSPIVQQWLQQTLAAAPDVAVVGVLSSGDEPGFATLLSRADVVLLDLLLPGRSGLSLASEIVQQRPVVVVSDSEPHSPMVREAMARGAGAQISKRELGESAGAARLIDLVRRVAGTPQRGATGATFVLVGSTGALAGHDLLLRALRPSAPAIVLLQHMPADRDSSLVDWVATRGFRVAFAHHGDMLEQGRVLLAPGGGGHLVFGGARHVAVRSGPPVDGHCPSASVLIESGKLLGPRLVVVVLSGLGRDGSSGVSPALDAGAEVLAADPAECSAPSMPRAALAADRRVRQLSLRALGRHVAQRAEG